MMLMVMTVMVVVVVVVVVTMLVRIANVLAPTRWCSLEGLHLSTWTAFHLASFLPRPACLISARLQTQTLRP
jgi:hypothetical protein